MGSHWVKVWLTRLSCSKVVRAMGVKQRECENMLFLCRCVIIKKGEYDQFGAQVPQMATDTGQSCSGNITVELHI